MGFRTTEVFVTKNGRQIGIGGMDTAPIGIRDQFYYHGIYDRWLTPDEVPTPQEVVAEYNRQWEACGKKVSISKNIVYAG